MTEPGTKSGLPERILQRLESCMDRSAGPNGCWPWTDSRTRIWVNGKNEEYTRLIWLLDRGSWSPRWPGIWRTCGTKKCCNPRHLAATREERFWAFVNKSGPTPEHRPELGPCWVWTHRRTMNGGYAEFWCGYGRSVRANRFAWELHHGPIGSRRLFVCHHCDNPLCVRPDHLFLGTAKDNHDDMVAKGRHAYGPKQSAALAAAKAKRGEWRHNARRNAS